MKRRLLFSIISCLFTAMAVAQVPVGPVHPGQVSVAPVIGFNASGYLFNDNYGTQLVTKDRLGVRGGAMVDILLNENLYLQPEGYFVTTGFRWYNPRTTPGYVQGYHYRINTVQVPVNITWKFFHVNQSRIFVSGGPYIGLNFLGSYDVDTATANGADKHTTFAVAIGSDASDPQINRFDFGVNLAAGYEYYNGFFLKVFYQRGLLDMRPYNSVTMPHANTYNYGFTLGFLLTGE